MGKRKRSKSKEYDHLLKKMKKLEEKIRERRSISSSSSNTDQVLNTYSEEVDNTSIVLSPIIPDEISIQATEQVVENTEPELDPEILQLLGSDPTKQTNFGENLHKDIMPRWKHILINGLDKDTKADILKSHLPPENCPHLKAPKLNAEIKAALNEINCKKECFNENKQNQLASCLAALGKALNIALVGNYTEIIKPLSDAGRLLCDLHFRESQSRRYSIINTLNKDIRETVKNTKIDEYLFGSDLGEQLKTAKAISKSSSELRIPKPQLKPTPQRGALNSRGARGAASTTRPTQRRPSAGAARERDRDRGHRAATGSARNTSQRGRARRY
ncbi:uncharacterized protein LOC132901800 [Amyelois transitella]|uniref:uncharacterized protein LOC132901800 n=1 Tax=Amyelois transitella TaxID=680683 RepID=UPI0029902E21|nr:uncharacterized protein LOC132901800 [Amyelois transitella]